MCELYGYSGRKIRQLNTDLNTFFSHAESNPDGWGMAIFNQGYSYMIKEKRKASKSPVLFNKIAAGISATTAIAHIRLATIGYDEYENTHPFREKDISNRQWVMAHNGTIFEGGPIDKYMYEQKGNTDSERVLLYLIEKVNNEIKFHGRGLSSEERFKIVRDLVEELSPKNKLNLLIYDGEFLYVHCNSEKTLYYSEDEESVVIATKPVNDNEWKEVELTSLWVFDKGRRVYHSRPHKQYYVPDEESIKTLFLAYSNL